MEGLPVSTLRRHYTPASVWSAPPAANWSLTERVFSEKWLGDATVNIPLDREKPVPLARQIQAHLERLIQEGLLAPGVKLPATRELARAVGVNRATTVLAYEELVAAGYARSHVGQGTFVAARAEPGAAGGGPGAAAVLPGGRLSAAAPVSLDLPAAVRSGGASRRDLDRQRLAAGVRSHRAHVRGSRQLRGHRAANVSARHAGVPRLRRPAARRPVGGGRAARGRLRAAARAPCAQALLHAAELSQSDAARDERGDRSHPARRRGASPGADRRGRLRPEPAVRPAAAGAAEGP